MPPSAPDAPDIQAINAACARISAAIAEFPYILSAPVNVEPRYHYPTRQEAESWQRNTPFYPNEEHLQYMTYVYREPGESCFVLSSHIDEEREREAAQEAKKREKKLAGTNGVVSETTRAGTPIGAVKKKMSFNAYKSKMAGGKVEELKEPSPEKDAPAQKESQEEREAKRATSEVRIKGEVKKEELPAAGTKRQRDPDLGKSATADNAPSVKKPRLSPPPSLQTSLQASPSHKPSLQPSPIEHPNGAPHGLPALLSPTNPFEATSEKPTTPPKKASNSNPWNLPNMLSPTLPPKIEAELLKEKERGRPDSAASSPASKAARTPASSAPSSASKSRPIVKSEGTPLNKVKDRPKEAAKTPRKYEDEHKSETPTRKKIVRLRYGLRNTMRVRKLLRVPPYPDREKYPLDEGFTWSKAKPERVISKSVAELLGNDRARSRASSDVSVKDEVKRDRLHPEAARARAKTPEKRPRKDDLEPPLSVKKQKLPASLDLEKERNPRTPISSAIPSPAIQKSGGSLKDSITVTPKGVPLKAVAMARSASAETPVSTPGGKQSHFNPSGVSKSGGITGKAGGPTSAPAAATGLKAEQLRLLNDHSTKYNQLGRKLKHANQDLNSKPNDQKTEPERIRMALLGIECILAYMLAYTLGDARRKLEGKSAEIETSWRTLLPLFRHMRSFVVRYKPLDGLWNYLGVAINARISAVATDRLSRSSTAPFAAADSPQSAIESGVGIPIATVAENTKVVVEAFRTLTDCAREAASKLPVEDIMTTFPATWASRSVGARESTWESLIDAGGRVDVKGKYWVPVGVDSSPVQAVRFGVEIIKEWIRVQELGYEPRIRF